MASKVPGFGSLKSSSETATLVGRANRKRNTAPELALRRALWSLGLRYRVHADHLPGKPDIVFTRARVAVFCDGDFWHGRDWALRREKLAKGSNSQYWIAKIERNMQRDREVTDQLTALGWLVIRIWEGDVNKDASIWAQQIALALRRQNGIGSA